MSGRLTQDSGAGLLQTLFSTFYLSYLLKIAYKLWHIMRFMKQFIK